MFGGHTWKLPRVANFNEAETLYRMKARPMKRNGTSDYEENERPMEDKRKHHYRIRREEKDGLVTYALVLFKTDMARYTRYPDGSELRSYAWSNSNTSKGFLWHVCRVGREITAKTTDGREAVLELEKAHLGQMFYTPDEKLDLQQSWHPLTKTYVRGPEDKARDADIRNRLEPVFNVLAVNYERWVTEARERKDIDWQTYDTFRPFNGPRIYLDRNVVRAFLEHPDKVNPWESFTRFASQFAVWQVEKARYERRPDPDLKQFMATMRNHFVCAAGGKQKTHAIPDLMFGLVPHPDAK